MPGWMNPAGDTLTPAFADSLLGMLPELLFPAEMLLMSLLFLFHGLVLLLAPDKYLPTSAWGQTTIKLVRKGPIHFGKRFAGFCLTVAILSVFTFHRYCAFS